MDSSLANDAVAALAADRYTRRDAAELVDSSPGLYAIYGTTGSWHQLGLVPSFPEQPLYVGKAEKSLVSRDVGTHFATGRTGSSTVRRSLAALLALELDLQPVPRNPDKPDGRSSFALDAGGDARLSAWMDRELSLSTWVSPGGASLKQIEAAVIGRWRPPLNLTHVGERRDFLRAARRRMAAEARAWRSG